ncbi:hypothetical protein [Corynebacterium lipophiloflavum]|uniref:Uncharacterized protein n=1 Tax=Corynebacterium lipophiloflavum (strain ATCC 700352 / DSM 44291 / CCUG 37336 / JCM 10383 / DMMZ 1944) TaxID=525263 RepID=C0XU09_CORLD|nr:hypothetical protein [Corynebacterium lipophiloflavum]EEI16271.1 hypothetical protein HMPREF0298_1929 [Corynebacterium lipophiloflavum DSM 44291]
MEQLYPYRVSTDNGPLTLRLTEKTAKDRYPGATRVQAGVPETKESPDRARRPRKRTTASE